MNKLYFYIQESKEAFPIITAKKNLDWDELDFQIELCIALGIKESEPTKLLDKELYSKEMIKLLNKRDLSKYKKVIRVTFNKSIIPKGAISRIDEERIKVKGEIWKINIYDADPFPSNPHAHNVQTGNKLHLGNGSLYNNKNKPLNKSIKRKDLIALRDKCRNVVLPPLE